jgi:hypothetical protein
MATHALFWARQATPFIYRAFTFGYPPGNADALYCVVAGGLARVRNTVDEEVHPCVAMILRFWARSRIFRG